MKIWKGCVIFLLYDNVRPIHFLRRWQYFEAARYELSSIELEKAKVFFHALRQLDDNDRLILMDAYYNSKEPCSFDNRTGYYQSLYPVKDSILAEKYGVTADNFSRMRRAAMMQLEKEMKKVLCMVSSKFVFRLNKRLYLVKVLENQQFILGDKLQAIEFSNLEENKKFFIDMMVLGFEKVPVN
jgi:hypothetical protein